MNLAIHISHEAAKKIGGIGSVLSGLCTCESYRQHYHKSLLYGPLFNENADEILPQKDSEIIYSTLESQGENYPALLEISKKYNIDLVYGKKKLYDEIHPEHSVEADVLLVGIKHLDTERIDLFKFRLWEHFGFKSESFKDWDYEQYLRIAIPLPDLIKVIYPETESIFAYAHEYMGIASCLKMQLFEKDEQLTKPLKTIFYAHEISTARAIVENLAGHDITFYTQLESDVSKDISLEERFGSQRHNYRNELVKLTTNFDKVIAVGDWVKQEYRYLNCIDEQPEDKLQVSYNGIPVHEVSFEAKQESRARLINYCDTLLNFKPDVIFTHVTRLVISKGLWRDIRFLEEMDSYFSNNNIKGFYILLSSLISSGRAPQDIKQMEKEYGWPVLHKESYPDLLGYEKDIYSSLAIFNAKSKAIKGIFINQYGFNSDSTGNRIPEGTGFFDIRCGSDVELGFSVYEPFGIAQIETIPYGGLAFLSRHCGCSYLLEKTFADADKKPFSIIDFTDLTQLPSSKYSSVNNDKILSMSENLRTQIESELIQLNGHDLFEKIPKNDDQRKSLLAQAKRFSVGLSWDNAVIEPW